MLEFLIVVLPMVAFILMIIIMGLSADEEEWFIFLGTFLIFVSLFVSLFVGAELESEGIKEELVSACSEVEKVANKRELICNVPISIKDGKFVKIVREGKDGT